MQGIRYWDKGDQTLFCKGFITGKGRLRLFVEFTNIVQKVVLLVYRSPVRSSHHLLELCDQFQPGRDPFLCCIAAVSSIHVILFCVPFESAFQWWTFPRKPTFQVGLDPLKLNPQQPFQILRWNARRGNLCLIEGWECDVMTMMHSINTRVQDD